MIILGGLYYEGQDGRTILDPRKESWPQAEAVVGFLNAFQLSGDAKYLEAALRIWEYIEEHIVDRARGDWFWRINEDRRPGPSLPEGQRMERPLSDGSRACLEAIRGC